LIRALFDAGADVFRLNFSHGTHDDHKRRFDAIRAIERNVGRPIGILQDLQGPKIRIGTLKSGPTRLTLDSTVRFRLSSEPGTRKTFRCRIRRSCATYCLANY
jgi:pyruvate kinase